LFAAAAERMNRLIQDLLEVKRIEGGKLAIEKRETDAGFSPQRSS
jgi:signal transduction histidine kinase